MVGISCYEEKTLVPKCFLKPICVGWNTKRDSAIRSMRARTIFSRSLHMTDVSEIGPVFFGVLGSLSALGRGDTQHSRHSFAKVFFDVVEPCL